jgi:hypothetical protein
MPAGTGDDVMTSAAGPETYAAAIERARRADQLAAQRLDAVAAVREAIDIPHAATVGDDARRAQVLAARIMHAVICLEALTGKRADRDAVRKLTYLRERLVEHPAEGYKTWDQAVAELRDRKDGQP